MNSKLLEVNFQVNHCGTKTTSVAIKLEEDLKTAVYFTKYPNLYICLEHNEFLALQDVENKITSFFSDFRVTRKPLEINETLRVRFDYWEPNGRMVILERLGEEKNTTIYYVKTTWLRIVSLFNILNHHLSKLDSWIPTIQKMIKAAANEVRTKFADDLKNLSGSEGLRELVNRIDIKKHIENVNPLFIDQVGTWLELMVVCPERVLIAAKVEEELAKELPYLEKELLDQEKELPDLEKELPESQL